MKPKKPPKIYIDWKDPWDKPYWHYFNLINIPFEKNPAKCIENKLLLCSWNMDRLCKIMEVTAICEFILAKMTMQGSGMGVLTLFNKSNKKYMEALNIEPVGKFIKAGEEGLLSEKEKIIYSIDDIASFLQDLFIYIESIEKKKYSNTAIPGLNFATCSIRNLSIFSGYYIIRNKKPFYVKFPDIYHTHSQKEFFLKKAALLGKVKEYITKDILYLEDFKSQNDKK